MDSLYEDDPDALERERESMEQIRQMWVDSFVASIPARFAGSTLENFDTHTSNLEQAVSAIRKWLADRESGLFLTGPVGCGKTHLAISAAKVLVGRGMRARYLPVDEYLDNLKASFDNKRSCSRPRDLAGSYDLLIFDDLGAEHITEWARDTIYSLIDAAYSMNKLVIVTSNNSYAELARPEALGDRCGSRLIAMTDRVSVDGEDYRKVQHKRRKR